MEADQEEEILVWPLGIGRGKGEAHSRQREGRSLLNRGRRQSRTLVKEATPLRKVERETEREREREEEGGGEN